MAKADDTKSYTKLRWGFLYAIAVGFFLLVLGRLYYLQIIKHDFYLKEASSQHMMQKELVAKRGEIYMMDGENKQEIVVMNERTWTVFVDPSYVGDKDVVQAKLGEILQGQMITDWGKVWSNMKNMYVEVARNVDYHTATAIKQANLRGVGLKETSRRVYPSGTLAAQVLGFVNSEGRGAGVEGDMAERLAGKNGVLKTVTDVNSIPLSIGSENVEIPAEDGENVVLSLDVNIQRKVEQVLAKHTEANKMIRAASALVMDPMTGQVKAMANYPTYNPERYWEVADPMVYQNRVTQSAYEPASMMKLFTYAIALNEGKIRLDDTYDNTGSTQVEDRVIYNANRTMAHTGIITFQEALNFSFNTGSVEVLRRLGNGSITRVARDTMYDYLTNRFGMGGKTGVELYEEQGIVIPPSDPQGNAVRYSNMTFGQGVSVTMMQMAAGFCSVINGGKYYQPTVVAGTMTDDGLFIPAEQKPALRDTISYETSVKVRQMLHDVRLHDGAKYDLEGYNIGIKTGTAETLDENGEYTSDRTNASVIGFGGSVGDDSEPRYVVMIRLDGDSLLWGSTHASPIFAEISNYLINYLRIPPSK